MKKQRLGKTKYELSKVGLGTVQFGLDYGFTRKKTQDEVDKILYTADKYGVNFIDTARSYGDSEEKIGRFTSENKNNFVIATKFEKIIPDDAKSRDMLRDKIYKSIDTSLMMLKSDSLDIIQLHQTDSFLIENPSFWEILNLLKEEKLISSIGISVYEEQETKHLLDLYGDYIDFFQVPYNVFDRRFENLKNEFEKRNIGVIARSIFLKGVVPCEIDKLPSELLDLKPYKEKLLTVAKKMNMKPQEAGLSYVYYKSFITSMILGVDSAEELEHNVKTIDNSQVLDEMTFDNLKVSDLRLIDPRKWTSL